MSARRSCPVHLPEEGNGQSQADIDAEIDIRVEAAGGQYANVDIQASLLSSNRNDLDVHVIPSGEGGCFGHKTERDLHIDGLRSILDVLLAAPALLDGTSTLDGCLGDMRSRNRTWKRIAEAGALGGLGPVSHAGA